MKNYQWHGEPVQVQFGYSEIPKDEKNIYYWHNYYCEEGSPFKLFGKDTCKIRSVRVMYADQSFVISNIHGEAIHKLIDGGFPNTPHRSIADDLFVEVGEDAEDVQKLTYGRGAQEQNPPNMEQFWESIRLERAYNLAKAEALGDDHAIRMFKMLINGRK